MCLWEDINGTCHDDHGWITAITLCYLQHEGCSLILQIGQANEIG